MKMSQSCMTVYTQCLLYLLLTQRREIFINYTNFNLFDCLSGLCQQSLTDSNCGIIVLFVLFKGRKHLHKITGGELGHFPTLCQTSAIF